MKITLSYSWRDNGKIYTLYPKDLIEAYSKYSKAVDLGARYLNLTCFPSGVPDDDDKLNSELDK